MGVVSGSIEPVTNAGGGGRVPVRRAVSVGRVDGDVDPAGWGDAGDEITDRNPFAFADIEGCNVELFLVE